MKNYFVILFSILVLFGCKSQEDKVKDFAFAEINALLVAPETSEFTNVKVYSESKRFYSVCGLHSSKNAMGVRGLREWFVVDLNVDGDTFKLSMLTLDRRGRPSLTLLETGVDGEPSKIVKNEDLEQWAEKTCVNTEQELKAKATKK